MTIIFVHFSYVVIKSSIYSKNKEIGRKHTAPFDKRDIFCRNPFFKISKFFFRLIHIEKQDIIFQENPLKRLTIRPNNLQLPLCLQLLQEAYE